MLEYNLGVIGMDNKYIYLYDYIFMNFILLRFYLYVFNVEFLVGEYLWSFLVNNFFNIFLVCFCDMFIK